MRGNGFVNPDLLSEIDHRVEGGALVGHPFFVMRDRADGLPLTNTRRFLTQVALFEAGLPKLLSDLLARWGDLRERELLLDRLRAESHPTQSHAELWLRFAKGIGVTAAEATSPFATEAVRALLTTYLEALLSEPVACGVAALYVFERQRAEVASRILEGLKRNHGLNVPETIELVTFHAGLSERHADAQAEIIEATGRGQGAAVIEAVETVIASWWEFLDEVTAKKA